MDRMKKLSCALLCALFVLSFAGCGAKKTEADGVDLREKLASLVVTDEALGLAGKYSALSDIRDGSVDPALVGTWVTADGEYAYTYEESGTASVASPSYGDTQIQFTCLTVNGYSLICEEMIVSPEMNDGVTEETTQLAYTAYSVEEDVLYEVNVEEVSPDFTSSQSALITLYRADENGSTAKSMANNPIALRTLDGTWTTEKGEITIENGTLTTGSESYSISFNETNRLVVERDGQSTAYSMAITHMKDYDYEDRTQFTEKTVLGLYFTGADENDKPNLLSLLDDWKTEYDWDSWYYSGSFELQK